MDAEIENAAESFALRNLRVSEREASKRDALCRACPEHFVEHGKLRCRLCHCANPPRTRSRCPVGKWGESLQTSYDRAELEDGFVFDDEPFQGKISLLINVHNEGPDLLQTILSFQAACRAPLEVVVLADMTTDDSIVSLPGWVKVITHHGPEPLGCGRAKARLVKEATGDFLIHSDGHNRIIRSTLDRMARLGTAVPCVVQPALGPLHCKPHEQAHEPVPDNCYYGGKLIAKNGIPDIHQTTLRPRKPIKRVGCVNNSCFGYPRFLLERFGGWNEYPGRWGHQEAGFSLRLWFADVPIYCMRDVVVLHRYQDWWDGPDAGEYRGKRKRYSVPSWHRRANRRYATFVCFDKSTWENYWKEHFELVDKDSDGKANAALAASAAERQREEFAKVKKRTDEEWFKEIAKMPFNPAIAKAHQTSKRGLYLLYGGFGNNLLCVPAMKALAEMTGEPIDLWDKGMHVKEARALFAVQPWVRKVLTEQPDFRDYRYVIGSYWAAPPISKLDGCVISPAFQAHRTRHEADCNMDAVRRAGYKGPTPSPRIHLPAELKLDLPDDFVAVCVEAAARKQNANKCYPHWRDVCERLQSADVPLVFVGNDGGGESWMNDFGLNLVGRTSLIEACRVVQRARLYLGIDNAMSHIAAAVGTPSVVLFGPTSPRKNLAWSQAVHVIMTDYLCAPCFETARERRCKAEPKGNMPCIRSIPPEKVAAKVLHLLNRPFAHSIPIYQEFLSRKQMVENCRGDLAQKWSEVSELMEIVRRESPRVVLEIGTKDAAWAYCIAGVCAPGTRFILVDRADSKARRELCMYLELQGYEVHFIQSDSHAAPDAVRSALGDSPVDVLHIDADHTYEAAKADYETYAPFVRPGGLIVLHDVLNHTEPGTRKLWAELKAAADLSIEIGGTRGGAFSGKLGIGVIKTPGPEKR